VKIRVAISGLITVILWTITAAAQAATTTVNSAADGGGSCPGATCTLRQAIATAASGDTINFAAGITTINLTTGELLINKSLTISGPETNRLSVQRSAAGGTPDFRIFNIPSAVGNVTLSGLTIANGKAQPRRRHLQRQHRECHQLHAQREPGNYRLRLRRRHFQ
jgi:CSLREA domain-containing protein